jgi:AraC-like DNA-binding protein
MASRPPAPALRGIVASYCSYEESTPGFTRRREIATDIVPVIIGLGPPIGVGSVDDDGPLEPHRVFVAGLGDSCSLVESPGHQHGVEIYFTPTGARRFLGCSMDELTGQVFELEDVIGAPARRLAEALDGLTDPQDRFDLLDAMICRRVAPAAPVPAAVEWAWRSLVAAGGRVPVRRLTEEIGWSHRHLVSQFRTHVGLAPKLAARVLRFRRAVDLLQRDDGRRLAEIAYDCGYADQAHLNRDFRQFAGSAPTDFLARRLPDGGGVQGH